MKHRTVFTALVLALLLTVLLIVPPTAHAQSSAPLPNMPTANGSVEVIVSDGAGGVYIGGEFTQLTPASGPAVTRNYIARINEMVPLTRGTPPRTRQASRTAQQVSPSRQRRLTLRQ